jgi:hypothetical protein
VEEMGLQIETAKKRADVFCSDDSRLVGNFFVSRQAPGREGSELVLDLLIGERAYLPFELNEKEIVLLRKASIVMVVPEGRDMKRSLSYQLIIPVEVSLLSGQNIQGKVYNDLPKSHSRLSDFLNHSKEFFHLEVGDKDYLLNSQYVKLVRPDLSE